MISIEAKSSLSEHEDQIIRQLDNFQTLFMAVSTLAEAIKENPDDADDRTLMTLETVLTGNRHLKQSKSFFLFRQTARAIVTIIKTTQNYDIRNDCLLALRRCIQFSSGNRLRAIGEAVGSLPLCINQPESPDMTISVIPSVTLKHLVQHTGLTVISAPEWMGRSLIFPCDREKLLVIKLAKQFDSPSGLNRECWFMKTLSESFTTEVTFRIPEPIHLSDHFLLSPDLSEFPSGMPSDIGKPTVAIAFVATRDYFTYPNEQTDRNEIDATVFQEIISRNSFLLGALSAEGFIHTAPVPLFHNRVQQDRRNDDGMYLWDKGGRLDQWLDSCRYPNFGKSGVRDFEHFELFSGNTVSLYKDIGAHILSLILVTGSCFRNIDIPGTINPLTGKSGVDANGDTLDARTLFDKPLLKTLLATIVTNYYKGFTRGDTCNCILPEDLITDIDIVAESIIDEMGQDKHMEEIFRVADQHEMSDDAFLRFLDERGIKPSHLNHHEKGKHDIITHTGPHLGGFNQKFSIPDLTDLLARTASLCITAKFDQAVF